MEKTNRPRAFLPFLPDTSHFVFVEGVNVSSTFLRSEAKKLATNLGDVAVCDDVAVLEFLNERIAQTTRK